MSETWTSTERYSQQQEQLLKRTRGQTSEMLWGNPDQLWLLFIFHHKHEAMAARIVYYLDMNNCACFCHYTPGWVQFNIPLAVIATTGWQQPLSAQASSTPHSLRAPWAEVMPGSQARTPGSEQGYKIRSKFRGLLSRLCNNYINQTGWPLLLMFYKRGFFTFYCSVSWDYVTAVAHRQRGSAVSHFRCLTSM